MRIYGAGSPSHAHEARGPGGRGYIDRRPVTHTRGSGSGGSITAWVRIAMEWGTVLALAHWSTYLGVTSPLSLGTRGPVHRGRGKLDPPCFPHQCPNTPKGPQCSLDGSPVPLWTPTITKGNQYPSPLLQWRRGPHRGKGTRPSGGLTLPHWRRGTGKRVGGSGSEIYTPANLLQ